MSIQNIHGGDLDEIERVFGVSKDNITNFSGNVNPLGTPDCVKTAIIDNINAVSRYPDVQYLSLKTAIASYSGTRLEHILVGNGATELISLFVKWVCAHSQTRKKAVIISPSYGEYEREAKISDLECIFVTLNEQDDFQLNLNSLLPVLNCDVAFLVVCNPNNPTGTAIHNHEMEKILTHCKQQNIFVMADETYVEFAQNDDISATKLIDKFNNLFIIRGTSKFFAIPGLRLGYALCSNAETLATLSAQKDLWSVNSLAEIAGRVMFTDAEFIHQTKSLITTEREFMYNSLLTFKTIKVFKSQSNFMLIKLLPNCPLNSSEIFNILISKGLLIRDCDGYSGLDSTFIRFCFSTSDNNKRLLNALKIILE